MTTYSPSIKHRIRLPQSDQIAYLQGYGNYTFAVLNTGRKLLITKTIARVHSEHWPDLVRIHKSYAINPKALKGIRSGKITILLVAINEPKSAGVKLVELPVARRRQEELKQLVSQLSAKSD